MKNKTKLLSTLMSLVLMLGVTGFAAQKPASGYVDISPQAARTLMNIAEGKEGVSKLTDLILIDVSPLYSKYHIPGARPYPTGDGKLDAAIPTFDQTEVYLVYSQSDSDSMEGAAKLIEAGFEKVFRLEGSLSAWKDAGYPVATYNYSDPVCPAAAYADVSPKVAKALIDFIPDLIIIDVSSLYGEGHIPGAVNYAIDDGTLDAAIESLDKAKLYLVYCHTDAASIEGAKKLIKSGFERVFRLEGNLSAWKDAGYLLE
ncbi:MAG: hypothetical protein GX858_00585 [Clostridiales bacterium]|nr:hypothetical protein [Clostridiales bacterium]